MATPGASSPSVDAIELARALRHRLTEYRRVHVVGVAGKLVLVRQASRKWPASGRRDRAQAAKLAAKRFLAENPSGEKSLNADLLVESPSWTGGAFLGSLPDGTPVVVSLVLMSPALYARLSDEARARIASANVADLAAAQINEMAEDKRERAGEVRDAGEVGTAIFHHGVLTILVVCDGAPGPTSVMEAVRRMFASEPGTFTSPAEGHEEVDLGADDGDGITDADVSQWISKWGKN